MNPRLPGLDGTRKPPHRAEEPMIRFPPLVEARLLRRDNRFRATARLTSGQEAAVHVPNSGRLSEVFGRPGRRAWLAPAAAPHRKTPYDLVLVEGEGGVLISVDARLPNRLFAASLQNGWFDDWLGLPAAAWRVQPEPRVGAGRLDFLLQAGQSRWWVETKSVTLVVDGVARFPDAPTARGRRHLAELCQRVQAGEGAAVVFIAQRGDPVAFAPYGDGDPQFPDALRAAARCGVRVLAYRCVVSPRGIALAAALPVRGLEGKDLASGNPGKGENGTR